MTSLNILFIVREALVQSFCYSLRVRRYRGGSFYRLSLDHHRNGHIIIVRSVFLRASALSPDRLEGVVSHNLSERLEGHRVDLILDISWRNLEGKSSFLVDWNLD